MDVSCARCKTEYDFDDALISERGTTVRCTNCGLEFKVFPAAGSRAAEVWTVRFERAVEQPVRHYQTLGELQRAIARGEVMGEDSMTRGDEPPRRLDSIVELQPLLSQGRTVTPVPAAPTAPVPVVVPANGGIPAEAAAPVAPAAPAASTAVAPVVPAAAPAAPAAAAPPAVSSPPSEPPTSDIETKKPESSTGASQLESGEVPAARTLHEVPRVAAVGASAVGGSTATNGAGAATLLGRSASRSPAPNGTLPTLADIANKRRQETNKPRIHSALSQRPSEEEAAEESPSSSQRAARAASPLSVKAQLPSLSSTLSVRQASRGPDAPQPAPSSAAASESPPSSKPEPSSKPAPSSKPEPSSKPAPSSKPEPSSKSAPSSPLPSSSATPLINLPALVDSTRIVVNDKEPLSSLPPPLPANAHFAKPHDEEQGVFASSEDVDSVVEVEPPDPPADAITVPTPPVQELPVEARPPEVVAEAPRAQSDEAPVPSVAGRAPLEPPAPRGSGQPLPVAAAPARPAHASAPGEEGGTLTPTPLGLQAHQLGAARPTSVAGQEARGRGARSGLVILAVLVGGALFVGLSKQKRAEQPAPLAASAAAVPSPSSSASPVAPSVSSEAAAALRAAELDWWRLRLMADDDARRSELTARLSRQLSAAEPLLGKGSAEDAAWGRVDLLRMEGRLSDARASVVAIKTARRPYSLALLDLADPSSTPPWPAILQELSEAKVGESKDYLARSAAIYGLAASGDVPAAQAALSQLAALPAGSDAPLFGELSGYVERVAAGSVVAPGATSEVVVAPVELAAAETSPAPAAVRPKPASTSGTVSTGAQPATEAKPAAAARPSGEPTAAVKELAARADALWASGDHDAAAALYRQVVAQLGTSHFIGQRAASRVAFAESRKNE